MTWCPENITPEEKSVVEELQRRTITDVTPGMIKDVTTFYRFAKARDFNLKNAEAMLRKHILWRKQFGVDTILEDYDPPKVARKYAPFNFICYDKEGSPVRYIDIGKCDLRGILKCAKPVDIIKYNIYCVEQDIRRLAEQSTKIGRLVEKILYIYDFDKLTFSKATERKSMEWYILGVSVYQDNYPELIKSVYVINVSYYFHFMYALVKPFVASALMKKLKIYQSTDRWKEDLLEMCDAEDLPVFLGGDRTDPDGNPLCTTFVIHGSTVPSRYYLSKSKKTLSKSADCSKLTVTRSSKSEVCFDVEWAGSFVEWEFETSSKDIGFGVYFRDSARSTLVELVPQQKIDTEYEAEAGMYKCEKPGKYYLLFDNSYSWIFSKEVFYRARIISPNEKAFNLAK